jgi:hypothetical protein
MVPSRAGAISLSTADLAEALKDSEMTSLHERNVKRCWKRVAAHVGAQETVALV